MTVSSEVTLLVLLDACRPDYLWRTEFLRDLAGRSSIGALEEPFGFLPRAAYFGGLTPNDVGYANIFAREPWRSPFPCVPGRRRVDALTGGRLHGRVVAEVQKRLPDFGARYAESFGLAPDAVSSYAITEREAPWGPACAYRSLFHVLDAHGLPWIQRSWPYTRHIASADAGIVGAFLDDLSDDVRFGFLHLSALDAVGHVSGPGSPALQSALDEIDRSCALLVTEAQRRFDRVRLLLFGDHGMVTVVRAANVVAALDGAGLRPGHGFEVFVDSPMARFWFTSSAVEQDVRTCLSRLERDGRVLDDEDLARYDADRLQPSNGELYFVAHPGVVFAPNAFQGAGQVVRGMHGYLPDVPDNRGLVLLFDSERRAAGDLGVVTATQIYPTCLALCGLDPAAYTAVKAMTSVPRLTGWTAQGAPAHEARVAADLRVAASALSERAPASAVIVAGSFGRGEGAVVDGAVGPMVLNDYDFVVAGPDANSTAGMGPVLAARFGTDFCDVLPMAALDAEPVSQLLFDLRYGGRVIAGDRRVLDRAPRPAPGEIPSREAARLLMNRMAGVTLVPLDEQRGARPLSQFAVTQLVKAWTAVGDAYLLGLGDYGLRSGERSARVAALAPALGVPAQVAARVQRAYDYRRAPAAPPGGFDADDFEALRAAVRLALASLPASASVSDAQTPWQMAVNAALPVDAEDDDAWMGTHLRSRGYLPHLAHGLRRALLSAVAAIFRALPSGRDGDAWSEALDGLAVLGPPPAGRPATVQHLEDVRRQLAAAWLVTCHA